MRLKEYFLPFFFKLGIRLWLRKKERGGGGEKTK